MGRLSKAWARLTYKPADETDEAGEPVREPVGDPIDRTIDERAKLLAEIDELLQPHEHRRPRPDGRPRLRLCEDPDGDDVA